MRSRFSVTFPNVSINTSLVYLKLSISEDEAQEIFLDRIRFKFHCAEKHLYNLKSFDETKVSICGKENKQHIFFEYREKPN